MNKVCVCSRFNHQDDYLLPHFIYHYKKLGVDKILINFNYKISSDMRAFELFMDGILKSDFINDIVYSVGPNFETLDELSNIWELYKLVDSEMDLETDYVIPADADEFVNFSGSLADTINLMELNNDSFVFGRTVERISADGNLTPVLPNVDIFEQFPNNNPMLPVHPKVGLIKAKYFKYTGVGHHSVSVPKALTNEEDILLIKKQAPIQSFTHHFRWNLQGRRRVESWLKLWSNEDYIGWKNLEKYKKILDIYDCNLLAFNG